jgi:hypothetical protein
VTALAVNCFGRAGSSSATRSSGNGASKAIPMALDHPVHVGARQPGPDGQIRQRQGSAVFGDRVEDNRGPADIRHG